MVLAVFECLAGFSGRLHQWWCLGDFVGLSLVQERHTAVDHCWTLEEDHQPELRLRQRFRQYREDRA